jgi:hypothetical protein
MVLHYVCERLCTWKGFYRWLLFLLHSFSVSKRLPLVYCSLIYLVAFPSFLLSCTTLYRTRFFLPSILCVCVSICLLKNSHNAPCLGYHQVPWSLSCPHFPFPLPSLFNISSIVCCRHLQSSCLSMQPDVSFPCISRNARTSAQRTQLSRTEICLHFVALYLPQRTQEV